MRMWGVFSVFSIKLKSRQALMTKSDQGTSLSAEPPLLCNRVLTVLVALHARQCPREHEPNTTKDRSLKAKFQSRRGKKFQRKALIKTNKLWASGVDPLSQIRSCCAEWGSSHGRWVIPLASILCKAEAAKRSHGRKNTDTRISSQNRTNKHTAQTLIVPAENVCQWKYSAFHMRGTCGSHQIRG